MDDSSAHLQGAADQTREGQRPSCQHKEQRSQYKRDARQLISHSVGTWVTAAESTPSAEQFAGWLRRERAEGDTFGYCLMLAFHVLTLLKWRSFSASHIAYFLCYIIATTTAFAWQRSKRTSYTVWRDWIQAAVRLECFFSPVRISLWHKSVQAPPPAVPTAIALIAPVISQILAFPVVLANSMVMHLLMLPLIHTLSFWPHVAVQLVCVGQVLFLAGSMQGCATPFFRHPTTRCLLGQAYEWLQLLTLFTLGPLPLHGRSSAVETRCDVVVRWFQIMAGFVASVLLHARSDAQAYIRWIQLRHEDSSAVERSPHCLPARTFFSEPFSVRVISCLAAVLKRPLQLLLVAAVVWDVLCISHGMKSLNL